ncbi:trans-aconitate 2-methyltransferase-related [Anaeramoeba flamelloides]|uniref:Trans-aconitate 2-methyltransferase-related n=1 Tax=Anaeramoeba flamelloides TaxID=1746091 RepID=A0ABQ8X5P5_9EUKA|nr:trans-aconitate 2-methyltransferase-related [Anaeramoeba flamelloides]
MSKEFWDNYHETCEKWVNPDPFLEEFKEDLPAGKAIDLGSSDGANSIYLAQNGWSVVAVDFSSVAIDHLKEESKMKSLPIKTICSSFENLDLGKEKFNLILIGYIHLEEQPRIDFFQLVRSLLEENGAVVYLGCNWESNPKGYDRRFLSPTEFQSYFKDFELIKSASRLDDFNFGKEYECQAFMNILKKK